MVLTFFSPQFGYDYRVAEMPVLWLVGGLVAAGIIFQALPYVLRRTEVSAGKTSNMILALIVCVGVIARLLLLTSEPVLEDDYQRYLWDGALTVHGINPYKYSPSEAIKEIGTASALGAAAERSGEIVRRINHADLRTVYPPVTQGVFAFAHWLTPWSLKGWRLLILAFDLVTLAFIIQLLNHAGRSTLWSALYWWNPLVLKELYNSAHMEAILVPLILGAILLAIKKKFIGSAFVCALAVGTKIWPVLLLPLLLRPLWSTPRALIAPLTVFLGLCILFAAPILLAGFDHSSGFAAYAQKWQTNSALTPTLEDLFFSMLLAANLNMSWAGFLARVLLAAVLLMTVVLFSLKEIRDPRNLAIRAGLIATATFLLSPAQFPWYFLWVAPFLPILPLSGLIVLTATLPLYYVAFHYFSFGTIETFKSSIVWLIWCPAWILLSLDLILSTLRARRENRATQQIAGDAR